MPNYSFTQISFTIEYDMHKHLLDELEEEIKTKNEFLNVLRPMPEGYTEGEMGYEWRCENWTTKWDIREDFTMTRYDDRLDIQGHFAWSPPLDALQYYQENNVNISIDCLYVEVGVGFCGQMTYEPGLITENHISKFMKVKSRDEWSRDKSELGVFVNDYMERNGMWDYYCQEEEPYDPIIPESSDFGGLDTR